MGVWGTRGERAVEMGGQGGGGSSSTAGPRVGSAFAVLRLLGNSYLNHEHLRKHKAQQGDDNGEAQADAAEDMFSDLRAAMGSLSHAFDHYFAKTLEQPTTSASHRLSYSEPDSTSGRKRKAPVVHHRPTQSSRLCTAKDPEAFGDTVRCHASMLTRWYSHALLAPLLPPCSLVLAGHQNPLCVSRRRPGVQPHLSFHGPWQRQCRRFVAVSSIGLF